MIGYRETAAVCEILADKPAKPLHILITLALMTHDGGSGRICPAKRTMAKKLKSSERSISRAMEGLRAWGVIEWTPGGLKGAFHLPNEYRPGPELLKALALSKPTRPTKGDDLSKPTWPTKGDALSKPAWPTKGDDLSKPTWPTKGDDLSKPTWPTKGDDLSKPTWPTKGDDLSKPTWPTKGGLSRPTPASLVGQMGQKKGELSRPPVADEAKALSKSFKANTPLAKSASDISQNQPRPETQSQVRKPRPSRKEALHPLPADFTVSDGVKAWGIENGYSDLPRHLEVFKDTCQGKGYKYCDFDAAFRNAIRQDWAKIQTTPRLASSTSSPKKVLTMQQVDDYCEKTLAPQFYRDMTLDWQRILRVVKANPVWAKAFSAIWPGAKKGGDGYIMLAPSDEDQASAAELPWNQILELAGLDVVPVRVRVL